MKTLVVEPRHPRTRRDLEVVESLPVTTVVGQHGRVAMQFGLEEAHHRFGEGIIIGISDGADRRRHAEFADAVGVAHARVLSGFNRWKQHLLVGSRIDVHQALQRVSSIQALFVAEC